MQKKPNNIPKQNFDKGIIMGFFLPENLQKYDLTVQCIPSTGNFLLFDYITALDADTQISSNITY